MMEERIIVLDEKGNPSGTMEKIEVHKRGILHKAYSVFLLDKHGRLLIQKRSSEKYHSPGLWSNSFCSHYYENENDEDAIMRGAQNELGIKKLSNIKFIGICSYHAHMEDMIENESDNIFVAYLEDEIDINASEVEAVSWVNFDECIDSVQNNPANFTIWFRLILNDKRLVNGIRGIAVS